MHGDAKVSEVKLDTVAVTRMNEALKIALVNAIKIVAVGDKSRLDDADDKFIRVRAERVVHTACEQLDSKSYRNMAEIINKSNAFKEATASLKRAQA